MEEETPKFSYIRAPNKISDYRLSNTLAIEARNMGVIRGSFFPSHFEIDRSLIKRLYLANAHKSTGKVILVDTYCYLTEIELDLQCDANRLYIDKIEYLKNQERMYGKKK